MESLPRGLLGYSVTSSSPTHPFSSEWSILLMSETVIVLQAPLGSLEKEKFPEWTTISSAWGNSVSWMKVDCYWRAAPMMVRVGADIPATLEVRQHGVFFFSTNIKTSVQWSHCRTWNLGSLMKMPSWALAICTALFAGKYKIQVLQRASVASLR